MNRHATLTAVLASLVLVLGFDYVTFAATGDSLILGKTNKATKTTKIQRTTPGPVVTIKAKQASDPPLATNAKGKVKNFNADALDGIDSSKLGVSPIVFTKTSGSFNGNQTFPLPGVPAGKYLVTENLFISADAASVADCNIHNITTNEFGILATAGGVAGHTPVVNGTGYVTVNPGDELRLQCSSTDLTWSIQAGIPWKVTFTPTTGVVARTIPAPVPRGSEPRSQPPTSVR